LVYDVFIPQLAASNRNFHIQQPGITIKDEVLHINKVMQGGEILYSIDDSPWQVYTNPISIPANAQIVKAKIQYLGKESNTTWLWLSEEHKTSTAEEQNTGATF
jgi:hypothetical protein